MEFLEIGSAELESGVTAELDSGVVELLEMSGGTPYMGGSVVVALLQLAQKNAVNASDIFFQCL
jgi:hypothetical protein